MTTLADLEPLKLKYAPQEVRRISSGALEACRSQILKYRSPKPASTRWSGAGQVAVAKDALEHLHAEFERISPAFVELHRQDLLTPSQITQVSQQRCKSKDMTWTPSHLTRSQMEERRLEGGRLLMGGRLSQRQIAGELGVNEGTVSRWKETLVRQGSEGLKARKVPGRPSRLDEQGQRQLVEELHKGAQAHGYADERWTLVRIAEVLSKTQGIRYDPDHLSVVMRRLGWSVQRNRGTSPALVGVLCPQSKAVERNEERISTWLETTLPEALKKGR